MMVWTSADSFGNRYKQNKASQSGFDRFGLFLSVSNLQGFNLFRLVPALDVPPRKRLQKRVVCSQTFMESLILAQDERWRRA